MVALLNLFINDFKHFIESLHKFDVAYILIGGYAVVPYGYHRMAGDLDIWVKATEENYKKLMKAFSFFGLPTDAIPLDQFLNDDRYEVFSFGRLPMAIDIVTANQGIDVKLITISDLVKTKKASGRYKVLDDLENLASHEG
jgi:hypothetical protein